MPAITSSNVAEGILKLVATEALPALEGSLVMGNLVNRDYEPTLQRAGDVVNISIPPVMVANNIAETGSVQTQDPTPGNAQIVLNQHIEASFQIPDVVKVLNNWDLLALYMNPAVIALAEAIETNLLSLYAHLPGSVGSTSTAISEDAIDDAETALFTNKVPAGLQKFLLMHQTPYSTLRQISRLSEQEKIGSGMAIINGEVGRLKNFFVIRSQFVAKTNDPYYYNVAFARDAFGMAMRRLPQPLPGTGAIAEYVEKGNFGMRVIMSYNPNTLAQQFTIDALFGCAVLRPNFGVQVVCNG